MATVASIQIALLDMDVAETLILLTHELRSYQGATATAVAVVVERTQVELPLFTLAALAQGDYRHLIGGKAVRQVAVL